MSVAEHITHEEDFVTLETLADIERFERENNPDDLIQFESTYDLIKATAKRVPDNIALTFFMSGDTYKDAVDFTYRDLLKNITKTANLFNGLGLQDDDVVAFILPNLPETHYVIWGAEARCQAFAINPLLEPEQIKELLDSAEAKVVVTLNPLPGVDLWPKLEKILPDLEHVDHVIGVDVTHYLSGLRGLIGRLVQSIKRRKMKIPDGKNYINFTQVFPYENGDKLDFSRIFTKETISSLFCTGGTTGLPKIAMRTHYNEIVNCVSIRSTNPDPSDDEKSILCALPLFHVNGSLVTGLAPFMIGSRVIMMTPQGYRGDNVYPNFWKIIEHFKISAFSAVPSIYAILMSHPIEDEDVSSLLYCFSGAAPMPIELAHRFKQMTGVEIVEGYGLTEATCICSANPVTIPARTGSIGLRLPFQKMISAEISDDGTLIRECDIDENGIILIQGPNVFAGYKEEQHNRGVWVTDQQGNRWLNTGDLGRQDSEGFFWISGRKKELIVRGGHNIEPRIIEEKMSAHPDVVMAAAVGRPDSYAGELPVCYVMISEGSTVTENELIEFAQKNIPEQAAIPKAIIIQDELPLTVVGKVFKPELLKREMLLCVSNIIDRIAPHANSKIEIIEDRKFGLLARVEIDCDAEKIKLISEELGQYAFRSDIN